MQNETSAPDWQAVDEAATAAAIEFYNTASGILGEHMDPKVVADALRSEAQAIEDGMMGELESAN